MPLFHLKFAVTIFIKVYSKMWGLWMHLDYDHFYIPLTSKQGKFQPKTIIFLVKKAYRCVGQDFWKKQFFPVRDLITTTNQPRKKLILPLKNTSKLWRTWPLSLPVHTFLSHLHFFKVGEVMLLKYKNLMLPAGHYTASGPILHSTIEHCLLLWENYTKLYFNAKHWKKGLTKSEG